MGLKKPHKITLILLVSCLLLFSLLAPLCMVNKKAKAISKVLTFDMLFSGVWANNFYPESVTGYENNIAPIRLYFDFYGGNGSNFSSIVTVRADYYSTGGQTEYTIDRFTYSNTYSNLRSDSYSGGLLPDYNVSTSGDYTYNDSGWFSLAGTTAGISGALICPMRIYFTQNFLTSSDDFITSVRMVRAYSDETTAGYRIVNRLYFYSLNGTCFIDLMQYFDEDSGPTFNSFSDNSFYLDEYVNYFAVNEYNRGYDEGYELGFDNGLDEGLDQGYDLGYADGSSDKITADKFFKSCFAILDVKIFGIFSISDLMVMLIGVWLVLSVLKIFAGG